MRKNDCVWMFKSIVYLIARHGALGYYIRANANGLLKSKSFNRCAERTLIRAGNVFRKRGRTLVCYSVGEGEHSPTVSGEANNDATFNL